MATLTKDDYFWRQQRAVRRFHEAAAVAIEHGMTEEQTDIIGELQSLRHNLHCNIESVAISDDNDYTRKIMAINRRLNEVGLPTIDGVSIYEDDYPDFDDMDTRFYDAEISGELPSDDKERDKWYLEQLEEAKEQLYTIHDAMERCLDKIDKIYNTNFAPTRAQRLY